MTTSSRLPRAETLTRVLEEADDIAAATDHPTNSLHVLLAFFTTRNQAERLLRDRGLDEDVFLGHVRHGQKEPRQALAEILERAAQVALGCGAREVDCLHVLVTMTRARDTLANAMLVDTKSGVAALRTRALTILTGAVPRWLARTTHVPSPVREAEDSVVVHARSELPRKNERGRNYESEQRAPRHLPHDRKPAIEWTPPIVAPSAWPARHRNRDATSMAARELGARSDSSAHAKRGSDEPSARATPPAPKRATHDRAASDAPLPARPTITRDFTSSRPLSKKPDANPSCRPAATDPATPWLLPSDEFPWLSSLGRNLSAEAARGELDRLVGREREIEQIIDVLGKRRANNPCLVGEPGVGKTAVVEGLAARLVQDEARDGAERTIIVALDVGALLIGTHLRGSFSEKLQGIKDEVKRSRGRVIVFFDELHTLVGAGSTGDGPQDAANELKSALARGKFPCIGATTYDEYMTHIEASSALKRRFVPVLIREPSPTEAAEMIRRVIGDYSGHHGVAYGDDAIDGAISLSTRYLVDRSLPDKALALLDLAGSRAARAGREHVTLDIVAALVSERTGLPVERLLASDRERLLNLEAHLAREIVGHRKVLERIAEVIRRNAAGFRSRRPQGSFMFVGPTGVGKTETAKVLADVLYGSDDALIRFDLSEFAESHTVARLVGAPPGYVGFESGGQLTEAVRRKPGRVILFDEIEKAHRDVLQLLLQILDEGRLTDGHGRTVSFAETIVILTSNLGADFSVDRAPIGFASGGDPSALVASRILERARERLAPELWGRVEEHLVFEPLTPEDVRAIARLLATESSGRLLRERGIQYELDESAIDFLIEQGGFDLALGARPMRHILARIVEAPIAARILEGRLHADERVFVSTRAGGSLAFLVGDDRTSLSQRPPA